MEIIKKGLLLKSRYRTMLDEFGINTPLRLCHFFTQISHESKLKPVSENLNYSAKRLVEVFPRYFTGLNLVYYSQQPERIANRVYANRMGNGNEASGEGWKYRGRGFIQITGKENYFHLQVDTDLPVLKNPDLLLNEANAMLSACWFWKKKGLSSLADKDLIKAITKRINGAYNGIEHRKELLIKWKKELNA